MRGRSTASAVPLVRMFYQCVQLVQINKYTAFLFSVAVRQSIKDAKVAEVEDAIKAWLQCACDRKGGRPRKNTPTRKNEERKYSSDVQDSD